MTHLVFSCPVREASQLGGSILIVRDQSLTVPASLRLSLHVFMQSCYRISFDTRDEEPASSGSILLGDRKQPGDHHGSADAADQIIGRTGQEILEGWSSAVSQRSRSIQARRAKPFVTCFRNEFELPRCRQFFVEDGPKQRGPLSFADLVWRLVRWVSTTATLDATRLLETRNPCRSLVMRCRDGTCACLRVNCHKRE